MIETAFHYILYHSALAALLVVAILLLRRLLSDRLSPSVRHVLWFFLIPVLLLPTPTIPIPVSRTVKQASVPEISIPYQEIVALQADEPASTPLLSRKSVQARLEPMVFAEGQDTVQINITHQPGISLGFLAALFWIVGCIVLASLSFFHGIRYQRRFKKTKSITDDKMFGLLDQCRKTLHVKTMVRLLESDRLLCPLLAGVVRPRIILPTGFVEKTSEEQLTHLFLHELAHLKRRDILTGCLMSLLCIVHWFNPFVWIAIRKMNADAEEAADQLAMRGFDKRRRVEYGLTLLSLAERLDNIPKRLLPSTIDCVPGFVGLLESPHQLSRRIEMIKRHETWHRGWMFLAVGLCFVVTTTALTRWQFIEAQTTETKIPTPNANTEEMEGDSFGDLTWLKLSGKVVAPEKISFDKFEIKANGLSVLHSNRSGTNDIQVDEDGTISGNIWADYDYGFFFNDPGMKWAAKPVFMAVGKESPKEKFVVTLEKGSLIEATLLDRETGKPISGMTVWLTQEIDWKESRSANKTFSNSELLRTDENGQIKRYVTPGNFRFTVDMPGFSWEDGERLYSVDFKVKPGIDTKPVLKIPPPFIGHVLDENGDPIAEAHVSIHGPTMDFLYTDTDKDGFFKRRTAPKNSLIQIVKYKGKNERLVYVGWVKSELKNDEVWKVRLREGETVAGRLLDAVTGKPLAKSLLFYQYENPDNPKQKEFLASSVRTDDEGYFKATGLTSGLTYRFFFVPGRTRDYNGGPYSPRVELVELKTENPGETVDLGNLKVDPGKAEPDMEEEAASEFEKRIAEELSPVMTGEKKGGLILIAASDDDKAVEQIRNRCKEPSFDSLAVIIVKRSEIPEPFLGDIQGEDDQSPVLFATGNPKQESPPTPVFRNELRGEKDSMWNVPKDDPSNDGDWKKTPSMVNPKILDNFLNSLNDSVPK